VPQTSRTSKEQEYCGPAGPLAATELSALRALTLAADLVTAARRRVRVIETLR